MRFILVAVFSGFLLWASAAPPQSTVSSPTLNPDQQLPLTSDLISGTEMQSPKPLHSSAQNSPSQRSSSAIESTPEGRHTERPLQTFTGRITKEGKSYVLRISDQWFYDLDDQRQAEQYLNQRVSVTGTLNSSGDLIHIHLIQPVS